MAAVFSNTTKLMLKNVIRHTNSHNKTVEEAEMWQQFERKKELGGLDPSNPSFGHDDRWSGRNARGDRRRNDYWNSRSEKRAYLSTSYRSRRAHMDEEEKVNGGSSTSTFWMRQLDKLEVSDPNRWDHSGYKELYPNDFNTDRSDSDSSRPRSRHRKKHRKSSTKKKKKHRSRSKKSREEKKSSVRHRKPARRRSPSSTSESDSESFDSSSSPHPKQPHTSRRHRYDKTRPGRHTSSYSSSSYSDSDTDSSSRGHSRDHKHTQKKKTMELSLSKRRRYDKTKSRRVASPVSSSSDSYSDLESDSRGRSPLHKRKPQKTSRESPVFISSTDSSDSVSSPRRKKMKTYKPTHTKRTESKKRTKVKRKVGSSKRADPEEAENQLVVKMWKEVNGHNADRDFDKRLRKEISSQYINLKRQYSHQKRPDRGASVNGNSSLASKKRRRYSSSSYSSEGD